MLHATFDPNDLITRTFLELIGLPREIIDYGEVLPFGFGESNVSMEVLSEIFGLEDNNISPYYHLSQAEAAYGLNLIADYGWRVQRLFSSSVCPGASPIMSQVILQNIMNDGKVDMGPLTTPESTCFYEEQGYTIDQQRGIHFTDHTVPTWLQNVGGAVAKVGIDNINYDAYVNAIARLVERGCIDSYMFELYQNGFCKTCRDMIAREAIDVEGMQGFSGSAVFISDKGDILTAGHVLYNEDGQLRNNSRIQIDGKPYRIDPKNIVVDQKHDVAILRIDKLTGHPHIPLADEVPSRGDVVWAIGFPEQYDEKGDELEDDNKKRTYTAGRVRVVERQEDNSMMVDTSARVVIGDSGGALVDNNGKLVGILVRKKGSNDDDLWGSIIESVFLLADGSVACRPSDEFFRMNNVL